MAEMIPAYRDDEGFKVEATSSCCNESLVYLDRNEGRYIQWIEWDLTPPRFYDLRCSLCNEVVTIGGNNEL